jgi:hypothetical protein
VKKLDCAFYYDRRYGCLRFNAGNTEEEEGEKCNGSIMCNVAHVENVIVDK